MADQPEDTSAKTVRTSVSLPEDSYRELERQARQKKVSIAWVVREAVERYLEADMPLFRQMYRRDGENLKE